MKKILIIPILFVLAATMAPLGLAFSEWPAGACTHPASPTGCYGAGCDQLLATYHPYWRGGYGQGYYGGQGGWVKIHYRYHEPYSRWYNEYPTPRWSNRYY